MDFSMLRAALDPANSVPVSLSTLPREVVLLAHQQALDRERQLDAAGEARTRKMVVGPGKHFSRRDLDELEAMDLRGRVACNQVAQGKVLLCRVVSKCLRTVAAQFVVEDPHGLVALVHLFYLPASLSGPDLDVKFPLGGIFAVREPSFREAREGFTIRIDSPLDLVRLYPSSQLLRSVTWKTPAPGSPPTRTPAQFKEQGNRFFAAAKWREAVEAYSSGLEATSEADSLSSTFLSNRAAAWLKLDRPGAALRDCTRALGDVALEGKLRTKLQFRAASAEYRLQQFKSAADRLADLVTQHPDDSAALELAHKTALRLGESSTGDYNWPSLFEEARTSPTLDVADFVGDMIAVKAIPGRGRGLVATRDIRRSELILVAKPLAISVGDRTRKQFVVGANLFTETTDPYATVDLTALLIDRLEDDPAMASKLFELHPGDHGFPVWATAPGVADTSRIEAIVTFNAFHPESLSQRLKPTSPADEESDNIHAPSSIYHTPSFMNHSCIGNGSYSFLADIIFIRARHDIPSGTELVDSYVDSVGSIQQRQSVLSKHGFVCSCELCTADRADGNAKCEARDRLAHELATLTDKIHGHEKQNSRLLLGKILSLVERIQATYDRARSLKPTLYSAWRLLAQTYAGMGAEWRGAAVRTECRALEALGAQFGEGDDSAKPVLKAPSLGDVNAVLSCLFIATQMQAMGQKQGVRHWIGLARWMEAGQAGEALFKSRYSDWASNHELDLETSSQSWGF